MKKICYLIATLSIVIVSCLEKQLSDQTICTDEFRSVTVHFKNASGSYLKVTDYESILKRTGEVLYSPENSYNEYSVATDLHKVKLSKQGDTILVSAKHPTTGVRILGEFVIKGGVCHIERISGPTELVFN